MKRTALVMGINGGFGGSVAEALVRQGWQIRALVRDLSRLPSKFSEVQAVTGDARDFATVRSAADGVDLIVYGVNPPGYRWDGLVLPMLENAARTAEELALTLVFPGNVYVLDPADGPEFDEDARLHPVSVLGEMRVQMEARLRRASDNGARVILLRMGNFIGGNARSSWIDHIVGRKRRGYVLRIPGPRDIPTTWAYLPDVGRTVAALVDQRDKLEKYSVFHFRGHRASFTDLADAIGDLSGKAVRMGKFPWWTIVALAPWSVMFRGLLQMRYLWMGEVSLVETKLSSFLGGSVPHTPLAEVLRASGLVAGQD